VSPLTSAQRAIIDDTGANRCVTSGAGCGKTRVLVERYIRFLEEDLGLDLARLAAITFTDAAAAQMRDRIRKACRRHVEETRKAGDTRAVQAWIERYWDVDVAPIDTIHAFCGGLLRRYAIEAGVDPNFALLDEAEATFLVEEIVRRAIEGTLTKADAAGPAGTGGMPTPPLRGHVSGEGENMPSERRAGHATPDNGAVPENSGTPASATAEPAVAAPPEAASVAEPPPPAPDTTRPPASPVQSIPLMRPQYAGSDVDDAADDDGIDGEVIGTVELTDEELRLLLGEDEEV
jgi:hypothetical protein